MRLVYRFSTCSVVLERRYVPHKKQIDPFLTPFSALAGRSWLEDVGCSKQ
jgi:hypothetical protein